MPIDFVILWVDPSDKKWQEEKKKYDENGGGDDREVRFRDWECLRFLFRSIEKYASWVRKVFFVTCGQKPCWLNSEYKKLVCISHDEFMPKELLPTFNSNAIQVNLCRIKELSEHFVLFDDDMFILDHVKPKDFFYRGRICTSAIMKPLQPYFYSKEENFSHLIHNNISVINAHFNKRKTINDNFFSWINIKYKKYLFNNIFMLPWSRFSGMKDEHLPSSIRKSTMLKLWKYEYDILDETSKSRFRNNYTNINHWLFTYWDIADGHFYPRNIDFGKYYGYGVDSAKIYKTLRYRDYKMVCLNDTGEGYDFIREKRRTINAFKKIFSQKSKFEI